jgi:hypothetical protein
MSEFTPAFFDESSAAWHANKIRRGPHYVYRCEAITKAGTSCKHPTAAKQDPVAPIHLCKTHRRYVPPPSNTVANGKSASSSDRA